MHGGINFYRRPHAAVRPKVAHPCCNRTNPGLTIRQTRHVPWGHEKIQATCVRKTIKFELRKT